MSTLSSTTTGNPAASISTDHSTGSTANTVQKASELGGRILLSMLFLLSGLGKIGAYAGTAAYMSSVGVPGTLLPTVIATEVLGALAITVLMPQILTLVLQGSPPQFSLDAPAISVSAPCGIR